MTFAFAGTCSAARSRGTCFKRSGDGGFHISDLLCDAEMENENAPHAGCGVRGALVALRCAIKRQVDLSIPDSLGFSIFWKIQVVQRLMARRRMA